MYFAQFSSFLFLISFASKQIKPKKHPQKTFCGCFLLIVIQFCQLCLGPVAIKSGVQKSRLPIYKKNEHETESSLPSAITLSASIKQ